MKVVPAVWAGLFGLFAFRSGSAISAWLSLQRDPFDLDVILGVHDPPKFANLPHGIPERLKVCHSQVQVRKKGGEPREQATKPSSGIETAVGHGQGERCEVPNATAPMPSALRNCRRLIRPDCWFCAECMLCSFTGVRRRSGAAIAARLPVRCTRLCGRSSSPLQHVSLGRAQQDAPPPCPCQAWVGCHGCDARTGGPSP